MSHTPPKESNPSDRDDDSKKTPERGTESSAMLGSRRPTRTASVSDIVLSPFPDDFGEIDSDTESYGFISDNDITARSLEELQPGYSPSGIPNDSKTSSSRKGKRTLSDLNNDEPEDSQELRRILMESLMKIVTRVKMSCQEESKLRDPLRNRELFLELRPSAAQLEEPPTPVSLFCKDKDEGPCCSIRRRMTIPEELRRCPTCHCVFSTILRLRSHLFTNPDHAPKRS